MPHATAPSPLDSRCNSMSDTPADYVYIGSELELFAEARHWKSYLREQMRPFLGQHVLEVGAGIGATTQLLCRGTEQQWLCLEPDPQLARRVTQLIEQRQLPACCQLQIGTVADLGPGEQGFDSILYVDVLEHIEKDREELLRVAEHLAPGGYLIVLAPAHQWLYTPFDAAIGHFRRYTKGMLRGLTPPGLELARLRYLDSVGLSASLANRCLLQSRMPTKGQIAVWDNWMVRTSRWVDRCLGYTLGKSVLGIWQRPR